ncbi:uncharacterized protein B0I36DRAFT_237711 [Microdochium trichocladiopsis]|uniref:DUF4045 domain-containing protein n=1 Tax=Microdochium trichocladiopsis TaxID=1682393 RepID=A0A9P8YH64_9PEZI|nr:uncharacterized protein B0I36DRAFT_237711 [Microdochium trichocladiopsis]KAH7037884.1 hypothetical protein B0I36DRAFT_237711 [Microdochium trichocladiopsis]
MSEDVSKFLEQVKELGERSTLDDEARARELEEKILQDKKERQARRRERARSISPEKSSPANTPPTSTQRVNRRSQQLDLNSSPVLEPPTTNGSPRALPSRSIIDDMASTSPTKENDAPLDSASDFKQAGQTSPTRSASSARGLSWQQRRPPSQHGSRSRPLSMVATENAARSSSTSAEPASATETPSRDQIASALSAKDPTWFRQTADRGANSAAYRRNQVEDDQRADVFTASSQLPGMAPERPRSQAFSPMASPALSRNAPSPAPPFSTPKLDPPMREEQGEPDFDDQPLKSPPALGRSSPTRVDRDRPVSPTKGMGGFVQSAMMKRSDSVNKRWSVRSPTGLQRADSVAANRGAQEPALRTGYGSTRENSNGLSRDNSAEPSSRPTSSRAHDKVFDSDATLPKIDTAPKAQSKSPEPEPVENDAALPVSPSKTMDQRRWSPTKSSWLETALNKPESPKPKTSATSQPAWMADIQKAKAQRAANPEAEPARPPGAGHKHQVSIGGLMKPPALGTTTTAAPYPLRSSQPTPTGARERAATIGKPKDTTPISTPKETFSTPKKLDQPAQPQTTPVAAPAVDAASSDAKLAVKPKPETPPKKDFRTTLKHRQTPSTSSATESSEPEFKNVFGNLRRTTTQNYKAPDVLKDNILRGKAGLSITGGPQKTERKDEFKDAILAKKKSFKDIQAQGRGVTRHDSTASEKPLPEGILRSRALSRGARTFDKPDKEAELKDSASASAATVNDRPGPVLRRETSSITSSTTASTPVVPSLQKEASAPGRLQGKVGGSALANRFNPALAGLLARGPPGSGAPTGTSSSAAKPTEAAQVNDNEAGSGPKLTHMTKSRARGPKRKAPTSAAASSSTQAEPAEPAAKPTSPVPEPAKQLTPSAQEGRSSPMPVEARNLPAKPSINAMDKAPAGTRSIFNQVAAAAAQKTQPAPLRSPTQPAEVESPAASPKKLNMQRMSRFLDNAEPASPKIIEPPTKQETRQPSASSPVVKPKPSFERPSSVGPDKTQPPVRPKPSFEALGSPAFQKSQPPSPALGRPPRPLPEPSRPVIEDLSTHPDAPKPLRPFGARPLPSAPSTPKPLERELPSRPLPSPSKTPSLTVDSPLPSPNKQASDLTSLIQDFFGPKRGDRDYRADVAGLLMERPSTSPPKLKTLAAHLFQFSADGRKSVVPSHHQHTLFDQDMYLCSHTFQSDAGWKNTEVYFWVGDEVPAAAVEDASVFVAREAKQLGGTLVKLQQGRETAGLIQALGGIIVTQRGTGNKDDSLAPHMFCGRRYLGQVVFDEVDYAPTSLCSGFPYLVAKGGKCFLWKGKGSNVDELGCARLIGMDYALTGELIEVDDGRESEGFWSLFESGSKSSSADHWRLKPSYDKYCSRLFHSDGASKQQITELSPFSQKDLQATGIYVLDAFFELYVIVGSKAQSQYASFHNALEFAQEYAILAAGMEDRPFVPISTVVLEGAPRDLKSVFRRWRDSDSPTIMPAPAPPAGSGLKRGRSMRVATLNQALQALTE